ncbi:MAG: Type 4 prepilin-like proteins leader peptide-processing enzyme [Alphaproteobacteria bacterium MarineAlpha4_Bin2]|nr:MAG: Type 4 prepilin-like proteins leader peptide-processing enzyme [Alphaproteobacteria bacterium MarineAlpha4_Bin2]
MAFDISTWAWLSVALTSLILGSFLNVVAIRMPIILGITSRPTMLEGNQRNFNIATPGSLCMICGHPISAIDNIPLLSFAFLRGRCRHCGYRISWRYPLIEFVSMLLGLILTYALGFSWALVAASIFAFLSLAILLIDLDHMLIPNILVIPLFFIGLAVNAMGTFTIPINAILGAIAGYLGFLFIARIARVVFGRPALGSGDIKLFSALGAWLGILHLPIALFFACIVGSFIGLAMLHRNIGNDGRYVPFGPFLVFGGLLTLLFGDGIFTSYQSFFF